MSCVKNCAGTPLCSALNLCCIQMRQDCGKGCDGLPVGYSVFEIDAAGNLEICSNIAGVCTCENITTGTDSVVLNLNGTFTHIAIDGTPVIVDICDLLVEDYNTTPWTSLPLGTGWAAEAGAQAPEYRCLCDGTVQLRGCAFHSDADDDNAVPTALATLPATQGGNDCRPAATERFYSGTHCAEIEIASDGSIVTNPNIVPPTRCFSGVSFYV